MKEKIWLVLVAMMVLALSAISVNAAVTGCMDELGAPSPYLYNDTGTITNVTAGNVCINETDYDVAPTADVNCAEWYDCVVDACSADEYYVGYAGDGTSTCDNSNWTVTGGSYLVADGYIITATTESLTCSVNNTGKTATYDACLNDYTRQGPDGYCDGAGALDTDGATLHVTAGDVCVAGANANPNATINCAVWLECVEDATSADTYYVGYASSGTDCVATGWVATTSTVTLADGLSYKETTNAVSCSTKGYAYSYSMNDLSPILVDGLGTSGAAAVSWVDLLVLFVVLGFIVGMIMKYKGLF